MHEGVNLVYQGRGVTDRRLELEGKARQAGPWFELTSNQRAERCDGEKNIVEVVHQACSDVTKGFDRLRLRYGRLELALWAKVACQHGHSVRRQSNPTHG